MFICRQAKIHILKQKKTQYNCLSVLSYQKERKLTTRDSRKSRQKSGKNTACFEKNREKHGKTRHQNTMYFELQHINDFIILLIQTRFVNKN